MDLITERIVAVTATGLRTADGADHPCDVLVYGTGFAATEFLTPMRITGRDARTLAHEWRDGAHAHLGLTVPGFPNMFLVYGPNTNTGNTSVVYFHEAQARYIVQAVRTVAAGKGPLEVRAEVAAAYDTGLQARLAAASGPAAGAGTGPRPAGSSPTGPARRANTPGAPPDCGRPTSPPVRTDRAHPAPPASRRRTATGSRSG